jgi:ubiquinone/menaquinone biosynthesis C-methylase UbiE
MRLNRFEYMLMNNPVRVASQRWIEAPWMSRFAAPAIGGRALEIGCGRGVGIEALFAMGLGEVHGFDVDPAMLVHACRRVRRFGNRVLLWQGSAEEIPVSAGRYDAVFDFGVLHHIPNWRAALAEISRVLRPGGRFIGEEMLRHFILHPFARTLFDHPSTDRFDLDQLLGELTKRGFAVLASGQIAGSVGWFAAQKDDPACRRAL